MVGSALADDGYGLCLCGTKLNGPVAWTCLEPVEDEEDAAPAPNPAADVPADACAG